MKEEESTSGTSRPNDLSSLCLTLVEHAPLPMAMVEGVSHFVRCVNPAFCRLLGQAKEQLVGKPFRELLPAKDQCVTLLDRVFRAGKPESFTEQELSKPHPVLWSYTMWPVLAEERPVGVMIQVTETGQFHETTLEMNQALMLGSLRQHELAEASDNSNAQLRAEIAGRLKADEALRESEERFRAMAENIPQLAWMADGEGYVDWFNRRWLEYTGTTLEENQGVGWKAVHHPDYVEAVAEKFERHLREGRDWEDIFPLRGKDGNYRWFLSRMNVIRDESGKVVRFFGTNTDITERRLAEAALRESEAQSRLHFASAEAARISADAARTRAETATRAKDEFLAALSHELRTPLNPALLLASSLADDSELPPHVRNDIEIIGQAIALQAQLVDDLLDITRITGGKLRLDLHPLDAHAALRHVCAILGGEAQNRHVEITLDLAAPEHFIKADAVRTQQIFWNVLKNAVKFTASGGAITVRTSNPVENRDALRIEIADTGIGIEPEMLEHIFDAFVQEEHTGAHRFGGIGLGLAIVRNLVELQNGRIRAQSPGRDRGASFTLELPLASVSARPALDSVPLAAPAAPRQPARRILLVEDHDLTRSTLARLLQRRGHYVAVAGTAAQARELASTCACDLVISDLGLPDGDGHTLLVELRNAHGFPAIALSGYGMEEDRERSRKSGFFIHLTKPVDIHALEDAIAAAPPP